MQSVPLKKWILTGLFIALGFVLSTLVVFPNMAPFQHMMNVIVAVILGPFYAFLAALITGALRMMMGRSILAILGGVVGAALSGLLYRRSGRVSLAVVGEVIGTGILSALLSYPVMRYGFGVALKSFTYYIPFFLPSSLVGALLGGFLLVLLEKNKTLERWKRELEK